MIGCEALLRGKDSDTNIAPNFLFTLQNEQGS